MYLSKNLCLVILSLQEMQEIVVKKEMQEIYKLILTYNQQFCIIRINQKIVCNIPLVNIGILPAERVREQMFMECKYDGEYLSNDIS
jgi:hypothetical protein